uniref:ADP-ribosylation factor-like protein 2-binding protein n=1 Tax=Prolemur simus TaxID=1328070 RepID=A0A8C9B0K9_PROSS
VDALEDDSFALSSASDADLGAVVGYLEDIIMDDEFHLLQRNFMDKYYQEFEDTEENKLTFAPIFNEYISLVEKIILLPCLPSQQNFLEELSVSTVFISTIQSNKLLPSLCPKTISQIVKITNGLISLNAISILA